MNNFILKRRENFILITIICEFFSYFGLRSLLVLYCSQRLHFSDSANYALFGAFTALIFLTPIAGGYLADRVFGFYRCVLLGASLIITGELMLLFANHGFYWGLSMLILGMGFFKTNAICLYQQNVNRERQGGAMMIYYIALNIGGALGPLVSGFVALSYGYPSAFFVSMVVMVVGVFSLLLSNPRAMVFDFRRIVFALILLLILAFAVVLIRFILIDGFAGAVLLIVGGIAFIMALSIYCRCDLSTRRSLRRMFYLTLFSTVYWVFDQQGGSSVMLFMAREVSPGALPPASVSGLGTLATVVFGVFWLVITKHRRFNDLNASLKLGLGFVLLLSGFVLLTLAADLARFDRYASVLYPLCALMLIGMGELFTDPVIITEMKRVVPKRSLGFFTGFYFLFVGAIANYLAGDMAKASAVSGSVKNNLAIAARYFSSFSVFDVCIVLTMLLLGLLFWLRRIPTYSKSRGD